MNLGLLLTALGLGLRHGIDWDHIAAIADLSSTAGSRRRGIALSMVYALGHAAVVFLLGIGAIVFGLAIPEGADVWMGRIVGVTLILLGAWILAELLRRGRDFRLRSRWMLVLGGTFAGLRRVRESLSDRRIAVEHEHRHEHGHLPHPVEPHQDTHLHADHEHDHSGGLPGSSGSMARARRSVQAHAHAHRHELELPTDLSGRSEHGAAAGIGMLHGVGIESPTQIAIFVASSAAVGFGAGISLLAAWVVGLIIANLALAIVAGAGALSPERSFPVYATLAVIVAVLSIGLGTAYLFGLEFASPLTG